MGQLRGVGVLLGVLLIVVLPGIAESAGTISGKVTPLSDPDSPIAGAVVTVAAPDQPPVTATTAANGTFSIDVGSSGPYSVGVQAEGFAGQALRSVQAGTPLAFALPPATFTALPVHAGAAQMVAADASTGIFYALANSAPEVYRTTDYGGSWQPATMSHDDPDEGLRNFNGKNVMAVSSVSGEVAVASDTFRTVSYSSDYGLTWRKVGGDYRPAFFSLRPLHLHWRHARVGAADNVLLAAQVADDGSWDVWRADMSSQTPAFVKESSDPIGRGAVIAGADSAGGSFVGRVSASGALSFAPLTATGPIAFGPDEATGLPTPPRMLRLGGAREASSPPDGVLAVGGSGPFVAQMLTKSAGATSFQGGSLSAAATLPDECLFDKGWTLQAWGSVAPTTTGSSGAGNAGACWLQKSGTGPPAVRHSPSNRVWTDTAYDADWGHGNHVAFNGGGDGPLKHARLDANGVPVLPVPLAPASAGTDPGSGGVSVNGITSPEVTDTAYGPAGAEELAVSLRHVNLASKDGGRTMTEVVPRVGSTSNVVQWWQGASGKWLLFGHGHNCGNMLSALLDWDGAKKLPAPNVSDSTCAQLGGPPVGFWGTGGYGIISLQPVPGTDAVFVGLGTLGSLVPGSGHHLYRARLVPGDPPSLADIVSLDSALGTATLYQPRAMAYCPASSAHADMRDVLFVATGMDPGQSDTNVAGSFLRITAAASGSPTGTVVASIPHDTKDTALTDVRADCTAGVVYSGGGSPYVGHQAFYKSVNGGQTFARIDTVPRLSGPSVGAFYTEITAIGLNPANANDVIVAGGQLGAMAQSGDGGTNWIFLNDPAVARPARVSDIEFEPGAPGGSGLAGTAAHPSPHAARSSAQEGVVGTDSGVFQGELAATRGLIGLTGTGGGAARVAARITTLGSDDRPSLVVAPASGAPAAVFRRSNGLHYMSMAGGSWSIPSGIPGTKATDDFPAAAVGSAGRIHLAFSRKRARPGIYVSTRAPDGRWSAPRRVSAGAGDTLPAIAVSGQTIYVTFLRTTGSSRGIYHASSRGGRWTAARKVRGTRAADASPALGGPSLDARAGRIHLAFARARGAPGIYYAVRRGTRWSAVKRLTRARDAQPALTIDLNGVRHIVFRRGGAGRRGLLALRGAQSWSLARIPGTTARDVEPALSLSGSTVILAFARPSRVDPGIYHDRRTRGGRWLPKPRRWSTSAKDRNPSLRADNRGRVTAVFERG